MRPGRPVPPERYAPKPVFFFCMNLLVFKKGMHQTPFYLLIFVYEFIGFFMVRRRCVPLCRAVPPKMDVPKNPYLSMCCACACVFVCGVLVYACLCVCARACVCQCVCICVFTYMYTHTHTHTHKHTHTEHSQRPDSIRISTHAFIAKHRAFDAKAWLSTIP